MQASCCEPRGTIFVRVAGSDDFAAVAPTVRSVLAQIGVSCAPVIVADAANIARARAALGKALAGSAQFVTSEAASGFALAPDSWAGVLSPGDWLAPDAAAQMLLAAAEDQESRFVYCDESCIDPASGDRLPFFKPDWSPELLESFNYIGRFWLSKAGLGMTAAGIAAESEYGLVLKLTGSGAVSHARQLLCYRGREALDSDIAALKALRGHAARKGIAGKPVPAAIEGQWRFQPQAGIRANVSIIIPTCGAGTHIQTCLTALRERTDHSNFEIIVIDNIPKRNRGAKKFIRRHADRVVEIAGAFNWSRFNNHAARHAKGDYLLFLNDDIAVSDPTWLEGMLAVAGRDGVGVVGPRLLYPDGKVQHGGMFLARQGIARHAFRFLDQHEAGYFGLAQAMRNVSAVTGACLLVARAVFDGLGGFDERYDIINNDLDFCLRVRESGKRIVYAPQVTLTHHELASRAGLSEAFDDARFLARWGAAFAAGDPYHHPNLRTDCDDLVLDDEPVQAVFARGRFPALETVKRILAVKIDHIGDFVTALPALRRLKHRFPAARLTVLAASASAAIAEMEPAIDEVLVFDFFRARSADGRHDVTEAQLAALGATLQQRNFDLGIDLRMHAEARVLLQQCGASVRAAYDRDGAAPWLDIALEWDGDRPLTQKRSHISEALLRLVETVAEAYRRADEGFDPERLWSVKLDSVFTPAMRAWFQHPVVCVHPGVGNPMRQWPAAHFAELVQMLVDRLGVHVAVIGGKGEEAVAAEVVSLAARPGAARSVAGKIKLAQLASFIARCQLYVGNNSGPGHLAAAAGVPSIGVYSGVVDPIEWAPSGPNALALARSMHCGPCYLAEPQDCARGLACLTGLLPRAVFQHCARMLSLGKAAVLQDGKVVPVTKRVPAKLVPQHGAGVARTGSGDRL